VPPTTPGAWLTYLEQKLADQQREIQLTEDYYAGRHRLLFASLKFRQSFGWLFKALADNWCQIVVDAPIERLFVEGFRFGAGKAANEDAWELWQANRLDAESVMAHTEAVKNGKSYALVAPTPEGEPPRITVEHPSQVIVETAAGDRRKRIAALKKWRDSAGYTYATLYLPTAIYKWRSKEPSKYATTGDIGRNWITRPDDPGSVNPMGVVPVVPIENNPTMLTGGRSDLMPAIPLQDAINKEIADMLVASEFAAFPQRVVTGIEVPTDKDTGLPSTATELKAAVSRFWAFESKDAKVSTFAAADLNNYVQAIAMLLQHLAAQTRTPPHYLLGQIVNVSGDALKAAETGLVAKVKRKQIDFSDSWEEVMRLALGLEGKKDLAEAQGAETIWRDPEYRSEGEQVDAAIKLRALGVPLEALWERIGATPQQVAEWAAKLNLPERVATIDASGNRLMPGPTPAEPPLPTVSVTERGTP
jgi:hypothetical protein